MVEPRAWRLFEQLWDSDPSALSRDELLLVALAGVRQEINSGGFDSYFRYTYGDHAPIAVEAANDVGATAFAALISKGMARLGLDPYSGDPSVREASIDDHELEFDDLDQAYYDLEAADDLDARMEMLAARIP